MSAHDDWIEKARATPIIEALGNAASGLKRQVGELVGPCPACGGTDRFSVNFRKNVFNCRVGGKGGGPIDLVMYLDGVDFLRACEMLTGEPDPRGQAPETPEERAERQRKRAARQAAVEAETSKRQQDENRWRERERVRTRNMWQSARPIAGTLAEAYLLHRGLRAPAGAHLRFHPSHGYFLEERGRMREIWRGPAMLAAITNEHGRWAGLHATWLDPRLGEGPGALPASADGKATIFDPTTGEVLKAKKTRGSARGGRIVLLPREAPIGLIRGEGIETALSVWCAVGNDPAYAGWAVDAGISLGNMAGKATDRVPHPTERIVREDGRDGGARKVPGPTPDFTSPAAPVPPSVQALIHLGDGDSEPFLTSMALQRAAARHYAPGREIRTAMAPAGEDFNTIWRRAGAREAA